jgi:rhodanese-related sulfurtransferase
MNTNAQAHTPAEDTTAQIPSTALIQPADLVQMLQGKHSPLVLQVGSHVLYAQAHIPGSEYVGAAGTPDGIQALRARLSNESKDATIVIYCGCCPWNHCPNIRSAYGLLKNAGFTHVKALYLAENFGADWVNKGYPVAKGR